MHACLLPSCRWLASLSTLQNGNSNVCMYVRVGGTITNRCRHGVRVPSRPFLSTAFSGLSSLPPCRSSTTNNMLWRRKRRTVHILRVGGTIWESRKRNKPPGLFPRETLPVYKYIGFSRSGSSDSLVLRCACIETFPKRPVTPRVAYRTPPLFSKPQPVPSPLDAYTLGAKKSFLARDDLGNTNTCTGKKRRPNPCRCPKQCIRLFRREFPGCRNHETHTNNPNHSRIFGPSTVFTHMIHCSELKNALPRVNSRKREKKHTSFTR